MVMSNTPDPDQSSFYVKDFYTGNVLTTISEKA